MYFALECRKSENRKYVELPFGCYFSDYADRKCLYDGSMFGWPRWFLHNCAIHHRVAADETLLEEISVENSFKS